MAYAYLATGSVTLAAAAFSDTTGFADGATLGIETGSQVIITALDQSGLANGINYLHIMPGFSGDIGSPSVGSLKCDVDNGSLPHILYAASGGTFYYTAAGNSNVCTRFECSSNGGTARILGGTITELQVLAGTCSVNTSTIVVTARLTGGACTIEDHATAITTLVVDGGNHILRRAVTTATLNGGVLYADLDGDSLGATLFTMNGGTLVLLSGNIPVAVFVGGEIDVSRLKRPATIAGTSATIYPNFVGALRQAPGNILTWTTANITYIGTYGVVQEA